MRRTLSNHNIPETIILEKKIILSQYIRNELKESFINNSYKENFLTNEFNQISEVTWEALLT